MVINRANVRDALKAFDFSRLFIEELGWDHHHLKPLLVTVDGVAYRLDAIAEKRGMVAFLCDAGDADFSSPAYAVRRKIENQVRRSAHEHLIIYSDHSSETQVWQWVRREPGRPAACREHTYRLGQPGDALVQKLEAISFSLDEEESLSVTIVAGRARRAFDVEHITKRFYDRFKSEHDVLLGFIKGIQAQGDREWYASLMLNRLMFTYFIQKKGFLDGDIDYLRNRLRAMRAQKGKDKFHSFYRYFLVRLFHEGLGQVEHSPELDGLLGKVPYLNGGLFDLHQLERANKAIEIPDDAFERIFDFFDAYQWHLDERPLRADNEINPDVLGYIFEKYINQKQMGAYYTREDITEYMSRNTVVPFLIDSAKAKCEIAFENPKGPTVWDLLMADPERYISHAVQHGTDLPIPSDITAASFEPAPAPFALPGETWRDVLARRDRYELVRTKVANGEIRDVGDLVTFNLDVRQFAHDVIENSEGPDLLRAFWHAIDNVTILDPTCGSGAFLFAALNILEPLYEACLDRIEAFLEEADEVTKKAGADKFTDFKTVLDRLAEHPNRRYFIYKRIILNNLFGVDIMEEAVEICKLRLFLKLAAQVEPDASHPNFGIEPLPDIDFNIKAGNTLVGFARYADVEHAVSTKFDFDNAMERIADKAEELQDAFDSFRGHQIEGGGAIEDKLDLHDRLGDLQKELNDYLANQYGVDITRVDAYKKWLESYQPFHWFVEFYGIMSSGGFDVIIGNPPYVQWSKVTAYQVRGYATSACPDIYAACVERSLQLVAAGGAFAMILPISFQFSSDFDEARAVCKLGLSDVWVSAFSRNPAALFSAGLGVRSTICIGRGGKSEETHIRSSALHRWIEEYRPMLFSSVYYEDLPTQLEAFGWPRLDGARMAMLLAELVQRGGRLDQNAEGGSHRFRFKTIALYYISAFLQDPPSFDEVGNPIEQTGVGTLRFQKEDMRDLALVLALGKIALLWWAATGDDFHVTTSGLGSTPVDVSKLPATTRRALSSLCEQIVESLDQNVIYTKYAGKWMGNYDIKYIRKLTDQADRLILEALGLDAYWDDIEVAYTRTMKATGERPGTVREVPDFGMPSKARKPRDVRQ